jgi:hypothetical protein
MKTKLLNARVYWQGHTSTGLETIAGDVVAVYSDGKCVMTDIPSTAITIQQPWAWAIAAGHKRVENRSWRTRYRGPIAIHASLRDGKHGSAEWGLLHIRCKTLGIEAPKENEVQRGAIIATANLIDCVPAERIIEEAKAGHPFRGIAAQEHWAAPGCWCWVLADIVALAEPVTMKGALGLWRTRQRYERAMKTSEAEVTGGGMVVAKKKLPEF